MRYELNRNGLTQNEAAFHAGVASATLSEILNKGHVPKVETLFRLADFFHTPRVEVLRVAGHLQLEGDLDMDLADEPLIRELVEEFRQVPDEWKPVAVQQIAQFRRLAELRPVRMIGEEDLATAEAPADAGGSGAQGGDDVQ